MIEVIPEDRKEEEHTPSLIFPPVICSDDLDAMWLKKGKKAYYGYKAHICVDAQDGFTLGGHVTPANVADVTEFRRLLGESHLVKDIPRTKGIAARRTVRSLRKTDTSTGSCTRPHGASPSPLLSVSSTGLSVEQGIGTLKRGYHFSRMRYTGITKGNMELTLTAMTFNLKKAVLMME